ncbi:Uncharacterised protein [Bacteroides xylanisolvens]|nr:Uncharacterised protein [Bacteroides xylanisolvens]
MLCLLIQFISYKKTLTRRFLKMIWFFFKFRASKAH